MAAFILNLSVSIDEPATPLYLLNTQKRASKEDNAKKNLESTTTCYEQLRGLNAIKCIGSLRMAWCKNQNSSKFDNEYELGSIAK